MNGYEKKMATKFLLTGQMSILRLEFHYFDPKTFVEPQIWRTFDKEDK